MVLATQVDFVGLGERGDHRQRRQGIVVVGQGALAAAHFVGQVAFVVDLVGGDTELAHGPVEQVAAITDHRHRHHRPGSPVAVVVDLAQRQVAPFAHRVFGQAGEPGLDACALLRVGGQRLRLGELQAQPGAGQTAERPFAHRLAGVVVLLGLQRIGAGPLVEPFDGAFQALRLAGAHVAGDHPPGFLLQAGDGRGLLAEVLLRLAVERGARLVGAFVLAGELQFTGVRLRHRRADGRLALALAHGGVVTRWRLQRGEGWAAEQQRHESEWNESFGHGGLLSRAARLAGWAR